MAHASISERKRAQKESLVFQEISKLFMRITQDEPRLRNLFISRISLSKDKGVINIYFFALGGEKEFDETFNILVLYKPSLRKALSIAIPARYTPELVFKFDTVFEKQQKVEDIFAKIRSEDSDN